MNKSKGFTLIELVIVIVILGILAVTAAPKFLNLQDDARVSTIKGLAGAMKSANAIVYGKTAIQGVENVAGTSLTTAINIPGVGRVLTTYGYPTDGVELAKVVDGLDNGDFDISPTMNATPTSQTGLATSADTFGYEGFECAVAYYPSDVAGKPAEVTVFGTVEGCVADTATRTSR